MKLATTIFSLFTFVLIAGTASAGIIGGQSIGIDFSDGGNTDGNGSETNWNVFNGDESQAAKDTSDGSEIADVSLEITGIAGEMGEGNLGFAAAGVGDYTGTPFSDLSVNDGVYRSPGDIVITISGLDDALLYDVLTISAGPANQPNNWAATTVDGVTLNQTYGEATGSGTNVATPISIPGASTDGNGNLVITIGNPGSYWGVSAAHVTAVEIPEPGSITLLCVGALGMIGLIRRKK